MPDSVRVRYAPSPTGDPHIGNIRTAMFNWLLARRNGGRFIVRVEDTDQNRITAGAVDNILNGLDWLGIDWDEGPRVGGDFGPYFQSQRLDRYAAAAEQLIAAGNAYRCYCSPERVADLRKEQARNKVRQGYDSHCRYLSDSERTTNEAAGMSYVLRFAMPQSGHTSVDDAIRGHVEWQNELTDDFVLVKSDGFPTYHMAVVVDDHAMQISHVLRAEEWLPSTPRHVQLYHALELPMPRFGHLPMILGSDRAKLSKRHGATSLMEYRDAGYTPEALVNFMALLGWSLDGETEVMPVDTIREHFTLERVGKPAAIFDLDKLQWMNGVYIRQLDAGDLAARVLPFLQRDLPDHLLPIDQSYLLRLVPLIQERLKTLSDAPNMLSYFLEETPEYDTAMLIQRNMDSAGTLAAVRRAASDLADVDPSGFHRRTPGRAAARRGQRSGPQRASVPGRLAGRHVGAQRHPAVVRYVGSTGSGARAPPTVGRRRETVRRLMVRWLPWSGPAVCVASRQWLPAVGTETSDVPLLAAGHSIIRIRL